MSSQEVHEKKMTLGRDPNNNVCIFLLKGFVSVHLKYHKKYSFLFFSAEMSNAIEVQGPLNYRLCLQTIKVSSPNVLLLYSCLTKYFLFYFSFHYQKKMKNWLI